MDSGGQVSFSLNSTVKHSVVFHRIAFSARSDEFLIVAIPTERNEVVPVYIDPANLAVDRSVRIEFCPAIETSVPLLLKNLLLLVFVWSAPFGAPFVHFNFEIVAVSFFNFGPTTSRLAFADKRPDAALRTNLTKQRCGPVHMSDLPLGLCCALQWVAMHCQTILNGMIKASSIFIILLSFSAN